MGLLLQVSGVQDENLSAYGEKNLRQKKEILPSDVRMNNFMELHIKDVGKN